MLVVGIGRLILLTAGSTLELNFTATFAVATVLLRAVDETTVTIVVVTTLCTLTTLATTVFLARLNGFRFGTLLRHLIFRLLLAYLGNRLRWFGTTIFGRRYFNFWFSGCLWLRVRFWFQSRGWLLFHFLGHYASGWLSRNGCLRHLRRFWRFFLNLGLWLGWFSRRCFRCFRFGNNGFFRFSCRTLFSRFRGTGRFFFRRLLSRSLRFQSRFFSGYFRLIAFYVSTLFAYFDVYLLFTASR